MTCTSMTRTDLLPLIRTSSYRNLLISTVMHVARLLTGLCSAISELSQATDKLLEAPVSNES